MKWQQLGQYSLRDFTAFERLMTEWRVLIDYLQRLLMHQGLLAAAFTTTTT